MGFIIAGPTASGKTAYAVEYAAKNNAYIINADALQLYKDLPILTASPSAEDYASAPHFGFGFLSPHEEYNATTWHKYVGDIIQTRDENYVLVGGTVFYIKTFLEGGLSYMPDIPSDIKTYVRGLEKEALHGDLLKCDPQMLKFLHPNDTQRLKRALEVYLATGESIRTFQTKNSSIWPDAPIHIIEIDRAVLRERIAKRTVNMLEQGGIHEVKTLWKKHPQLATMPIAKVIGVKEIVSYLQDEISYEAMVERIQILTMQYAKRQVTFCRHLQNATQKTQISA